jgi:hypothetical protein
LGITENAFHFIADQHRNPFFWRRNKSWEWEYIPLDFGIGVELNQNKSFNEFIITEKGKSSDNESDFILYGKGVV